MKIHPDLSGQGHYLFHPVSAAPYDLQSISTGQTLQHISRNCKASMTYQTQYLMFNFDNVKRSGCIPALKETKTKLMIMRISQSVTQEKPQALVYHWDAEPPHERPSNG